MTGSLFARLARGAAIVLGLTTSGLATADEIKIGAVLPMTGDAASYGAWMRNGMNIAVDQINAKWGAERKLTLVYEDSKSNPRDGVAAMNKLISADRVGAVMTTLTGITKALIPIAEEKKVILTTSATLPGITEGKSYIFRNATNLGSEIRALNEFAKTRYKKAAILWVNLEWADWGSKAFEKQFKADGGEVVESLAFAPDATDMRAQLTRIRIAKPDVILVLAYKTTGQVLKQARELGIELQFIGTLDFELPEVVQIAKEAAEGSVYTKAVFDSANPTAGVMADYTKEYEKRYSQKPEVYSATMYDMLLILSDALANSKGDTEAARKAILAVKDFPGASGMTTFLPNGDVEKAVELKTMKGGQYVDYKN